MPPNPIRILHLDDNPLDAELVTLALNAERDKLPAVVNYVRTREEYLAALERKDIDLILSDYRMGDYDGDQALTAARERCPEVPFIMVTGELSEELVIETLKRGATDYVLKDRIFRLVPAIQRALIEAENEKKRLAAEHSLQESEERYRRVVDNIHDALLIDDVQGHVVFTNERFLELFGIRRKDTATMSIEDYVVPEYREELRVRHERRMRGEEVPARFEYQGMRKDGTRLWLDVSVVPLFERGRPIGTQSTIRDITSRKMAEEALRVSETLAIERLAEIEALYQNAPIGLCVLDRQLRWVRLNRAIAEINGVPAEDHLGKTPREVVPDLADQAEAALRKILETGEPLLDFEMTGTTAAQPGVLRSWNERWAPIKDNRGRIVGISVATEETTTRKKMEVELRESEERFRAAVDNAPYVYLLYDAGLQIRFINKAGIARSGLSMDEMLGHRDEELFSREVTDSYLNYLRRCLETKEAQTLEATHALPGVGTTASIVHYIPLLDKEGSVRQILGIIYDITERKHTEDELRKAHQNLDDVLESVQDPLYGLDSEWRFAYVNAKAEEAMGKKRSELLGWEFFTIFPNAKGTDTEHHLRKAMCERMSVRFESNFVPDGNTVEIFAAPKQDGGISMMCRDISSRIRAVKALCESEERYAAVFERSPFAFALVKLPDVRIVAANEATLRLFEFSKDEVIGRTTLELGIVDKDAREKLVQELLEKGMVRDFEATRRSRAGALRRLSLNVNWVTIGGEQFVLAAIQDITERKRVEEELAEAHQRLGGILNSITGGYYALDREWRFTAGNVTAEGYFGLPLAELLGKNFWELTKTSSHSFVYRKFDEARASGQPTHFEAQSHIRPDYWAEIHLYPRGESLEVFFADISARKQAEGELRRANQNLERRNRELEAERLKWQRLIEGIADEVWACDPHGKVSMVNLATQKNLGLMDFERHSLEDTLKEIDVFYPDGSLRPDEESPLRRSLQGDVLRGEEIVRNRRTGTSRIRQYSSAPVGDAEGRIVGAVAVIRDVTEERQAEVEIRKLNEELEERVRHRTAALERVNKELESFSYSVSHDLKAPLRLITGFAALMGRQAESNLTPKQMEYLTTIQEQAGRMDELIRALLEFSRITRKEPTLMPVDTRRLVEEATREQRQLLGEEAGRRVQVKIADLPVVRADAVLLRMVFTNLLSNAFKFTRTVSEPTIAVEATQKSGFFQFRVADNGVGFPKGQTEKLFKVFQRLHGTGEFEGSGIGLANVRKIIERHGGQVCGEGEEGKGATFYFTLPTDESVDKTG